MHRLLPAAVGLGVLAMAPGCFLVVDDLDDFTSEREHCDLDLRLDSFVVQETQPLEVRVVTIAGAGDGVTRAYAHIDHLPSPTPRIYLPDGLVPDGSNWLRMFVDADDDGAYSRDVDVGWLRGLSCNADPIDFVFPDEEPTVLGAAVEQYADMSLALSGIPAIGNSFELRVVEIDTGRTVGLVWRAKNMEDAFDVVVPGIAAPERRYEISFWSDDNGTGAYEGPPADSSWRVELTGTQATAHTFAPRPGTDEIGPPLVTARF